MVVVAGVDVQSRAQSSQIHDLLDVTACFFDAHHVFTNIHDLLHGGGQDVEPCAGGHVVHDNRDMDLLANGPVMGHEALLGGFIIVRGHDEKPVHTQGFRRPGEVDDRSGVVAAGACDDR